MRPDMSFGARLRHYRERAGKTRAVLGGLVERRRNDRTMIMILGTS
jgi:hypothetical protein